MCKNSPYSSSDLVCTSWSTNGRRVQISEPLGKKSRPTRASSTLDLPLLWLPTTATWGSSMVDWLPNWEKMSWSLFTIGMTELPNGETTSVEEDDVEGGTCSLAMDNDGSGEWSMGCRIGWRRDLWVCATKERRRESTAVDEEGGGGGHKIRPPSKFWPTRRELWLFSL